MIKIRLLHEEDANAVIMLVKQVIKTCQTVIVTLEEFQPTQDEERSYIRSYAERPGSLALGAFLDKKLIGCLFLEREKRQRRSHTGALGLSVHPSYWNMGVGTALIQEMILQAHKERILSRIELSVMENNIYAERLFRNAGFYVEGRRQGSIRIDDVDFDEIMMVLMLV